MRSLVSAALIAAALAAGCSSDDPDTSAEGRIIRVEMADNTYSPSSFDVDEGETVTFEFVNDGRMTHEAYIGDQRAQEDHAAEMMGGDDGHSMDMDGDDTVVVDAGETRTMTHTFSEAGSVLIGCHQPGHWESGMKATVDVG